MYHFTKIKTSIDLFFTKTPIFYRKQTFRKDSLGF